MRWLQRNFAIGVMFAVACGGGGGGTDSHDAPARDVDALSDGVQCTPTGTEDSASACADSVDNDCDGATDCRDSACAGFCPAESSNARCNNGEDDDMDGLVDCLDPDCAARIVCAGEVTNAACSDGVDNDSANGTDCADPACQDEAIVVCNGTTPVSVASSQWVTMVATRCSNGTTDDADALFDCGERSCLWNYPSCTQPPAERTNTLCSDGNDNDRDGATDCNDPGCQAEGIVVCNGTTPTGASMANWKTLAETRCSNASDDDGANGTDCNDFSCSHNPDVTLCPESNNTNCSDGSDDNTNGFTDCADLSCSANEAVSICDGALENTYAECNNGLDDDGDGLRDCADTTSCNASSSARSAACL